MRYLPYLYNGHYGPPYMSFGWHMITLFGIDLQKKWLMLVIPAWKKPGFLTPGFSRPGENIIGLKKTIF